MPVVFLVSLSNQPEQTKFTLELSSFLFAKISSLQKVATKRYSTTGEFQQSQKIVVGLKNTRF